MSDIIEPSNTDLSATPEVVQNYIEGLHDEIERLREALFQVAYHSDDLDANPTKWSFYIAYSALGGRMKDGQLLDNEQSLRAAPEVSDD